MESILQQGKWSVNQDIVKKGFVFEPLHYRQQEGTSSINEIQELQTKVHELLLLAMKENNAFATVLRTSQHTLRFTVYTAGKSIDFFLDDFHYQNRMIRNYQLLQKQRKQYKLFTTNLLDSLSHEFRTPINGIVGFSDLIIKECRNSSIISMSETIKVSALRLLDVLTELVDASSLQAGSFQMLYSRFTLGDVFLEILNHQQLMEQAQQNQVELILPEKHFNHVIHSDQSALTKILSHLLENSIEHSQYSAVTVCFIQTESNYLFVVSDQGQGFNVRNHPEEPFVSEEKYQAFEKNGLGLGLSIVRELIRLMNGSLKIKSKPGHGTTVKIEIPIMG
ncbi:MAG: sensor histidine kinase [Bacteroidota bacterium]